MDDRIRAVIGEYAEAELRMSAPSLTTTTSTPPG